MRLEELQRLLLDMLSTQRPVDVATVTQLGEEDWQAILGMVRQHRLGPLLHWQLTHERAGVPVPETVRSALAGMFRAAAMRSLSAQRDLLEVCRLLNAAGIPSIPLKGAFLAYFSYPHAALRPLRDIDLLVPADLGVAAFTALVDAGYLKFDYYGGDPEHCAETARHLPPLRAAADRLLIELHVRLPGYRTDRQSQDDVFDYWQRTNEKSTGGMNLRYLGPTDLLYLLIVHAAYEHKLDNGPLVLSDIRYLVNGSDIDWPLFWRLAEAGNTARGCELLLRMTEHYFGSLPIRYSREDAGVPEGFDAMIAVAPALFLRDERAGHVMVLAGGLAGKSLRDKLGALWDGIALPKHRSSDTSPWAICRDLSRRIWKLGSKYLPALWANRGNAAMSDEVRKVAQYNRWLER